MTIMRPIRWRSFGSVALLGLVAGLWSGATGWAQQAANVILDSNEQLFDVMAAINAAGYNSGLGPGPESNVRQQVRSSLAAEKIPILPELSAFYDSHKLESDPGADLGQFVSLALLLGSPPNFRPTVAAKDLPPDAKAVRDLLPILKTFYHQAGLLNLWARLQPAFAQALAVYTNPARRDIALSDAYLRFPSGSYLGRTYHIYLCLLAAPGEVEARIYGENYYLVVAPSKQPKLAEIRHQYLHFLLDPMAVKYGALIEQKKDLASLARNAPTLGADFKDDFSLLLTECLIRAVELRMDKPQDAEKRVGAFTAEGLILTPYFYAALADYEKQPASMISYYQQIVSGIKVREEQERLAGVKFAPIKPVETVKEAAPLSAKDRTLDEGDNLIYQGKYLEAKEVFQQVLTQYDAHDEGALFGFAVAASNLRKPDTAVSYFKKTLAVAKSARIVTWSHIYLGRLYDLEGDRAAALEQYRAASVTAGALPDALRAVQSGLRQPYGMK